MNESSELSQGARPLRDHTRIQQTTSLAGTRTLDAGETHQSRNARNNGGDRRGILGLEDGNASRNEDEPGISLDGTGRPACGFMRKVYAVLSLQLLLTVVGTGLCVHDGAVRGAIARNTWSSYLAVEVCVVTLLGLYVFGEVRRARHYIFVAWSVVAAGTIGVVCASCADREQGLAVVRVEGLALVLFLLDILLTFQDVIDIFLAGMALPIAGLVVLLAWQWQAGAPRSFPLPQCAAAFAFAFWFPFNSGRMISRMEGDDFVAACADVYVGVIRGVIFVLVNAGEGLVALAACLVDVLGNSCLRGERHWFQGEDENSDYDSYGEFFGYRDRRGYIGSGGFLGRDLTDGSGDGGYGGVSTTSAVGRGSDGSGVGRISRAGGAAGAASATRTAGVDGVARTADAGDAAGAAGY